MSCHNQRRPLPQSPCGGTLHFPGYTSPESTRFAGILPAVVLGTLLCTLAPALVAAEVRDPAPIKENAEAALPAVNVTASGVPGGPSEHTESQEKCKQ